MNNKKHGWFGDPVRHSLASQGVQTAHGKIYGYEDRTKPSRLLPIDERLVPDNWHLITPSKPDELSQELEYDFRVKVGRRNFAIARLKLEVKTGEEKDKFLVSMDFAYRGHRDEFYEAYRRNMKELYDEDELHYLFEDVLDTMQEFNKEFKKNKAYHRRFLKQQKKDVRKYKFR